MTKSDVIAEGDVMIRGLPRWDTLGGIPSVLPWWYTQVGYSSNDAHRYASVPGLTAVTTRIIMPLYLRVKGSNDAHHLPSFPRVKDSNDAHHLSFSSQG